MSTTPDNGLYLTMQERIAGDVAVDDAFADAASLPFGDRSVGFLLASHVIEHMPDAIRALREWDRVVRPGGVVFLIVPHRERTEDLIRPRTDLRHHFVDHALAVEAASDPMVPGSHYHVWITEDFVALVTRLVEARYLRWEILCVEDVDSKAGNGFTVAARKLDVPDPPPDPPAGTDVAFHQWTARPLPVPGHQPHARDDRVRTARRTPNGLARGRVPGAAGVGRIPRVGGGAVRGRRRRSGAGAGDRVVSDGG